MKFVAKVWRLGGSLVVTIPKEIVKEEGIRERELVKIDVKKFKAE